MLEYLAIAISGTVCSVFVIGLLLDILHRVKLTLDTKNLAVVITGCDTGFGCSTAELLANAGFIVVAGCLTPEGVNRLKNKVALGIQCDVTKEEDITKLATETSNLLKSKNIRLWAVINNAGIAQAGYFDWIPPSLIRKQMDVNYFGVVNVTRALMPFLQRCKNSRIINISSAAGFSGVAGMNGYCASKHALEGFSKCLRAELLNWNVHVCNINPGFMSTPLIGSTVDQGVRLYEAAGEEIKATYPISIIQNLQSGVDAVKEDPALVVSAIVDAVYYRSPAPNTYPGYQAKFIIVLNKYLPASIQFFIERGISRLLSSGPNKEVVTKLQQ